MKEREKKTKGNYMLYVKALKIKKLITVVISTSLELFLRLVKRIVKELDLLVPWPSSFHSVTSFRFIWYRYQLAVYVSGRSLRNIERFP